MSEIVFPEPSRRRDLILTIRERLVRRDLPLGVAAEQQVRGVPPDEAPPAPCLFDRGHELFELAALRQIADRASAEGAACKLRGRVHAQNQRREIWGECA